MQVANESEHIGTDRSGTGMVVGVITFLVGVGLLLLTFKLAYDLFTVPPSQILAQSGPKGDAIDLGKSGNNLVTLIIRVLLLIVMGLVGSLIANRGVSMFTHSRTQRHRVGKQSSPKSIPSESAEGNSDEAAS